MSTEQTRTQAVDSILQVIRDVKSNLDEMCDSISPFTGNKRVVTSTNSKLCLDTGYCTVSDPNFSSDNPAMPEYIRNSTVKDDNQIEWAYSIQSNDDFLLQPAAFTNDDPPKATLWGLSKLTLIVDPANSDLTGAIMLNDDWFEISTTYFENFVDAFISYKLLSTTYSTSANVN